MDAALMISTAIKQNNIIQAITLYSEFLQRIITNITHISKHDIKNSEINTIITHLINKETNINAIIINVLYYLLRKSKANSNDEKKQLEQNVENSKYIWRKISEARTTAQLITLMQDHPHVFLPPNFDALLSRLLSVGYDELEKIGKEEINEENIRKNNNVMCEISKIYKIVVSGYTQANVINAQYEHAFYATNTIWFQQLQLLNYIHQYLCFIFNQINETFMKIKRKENNDSNKMLFDSINLLDSKINNLTDTINQSDTNKIHEINKEMHEMLKRMKDTYENEIKNVTNQLIIEKQNSLELNERINQLTSEFSQNTLNDFDNIFDDDSTNKIQSKTVNEKEHEIKNLVNEKEDEIKTLKDTNKNLLSEIDTLKNKNDSTNDNHSILNEKEHEIKNLISEINKLKSNNQYLETEKQSEISNVKINYEKYKTEIEKLRNDNHTLSLKINE